MRVKINEDEKTATDGKNNYLIKGLIIRKPDNKPSVYYEFGTSLCNAVIFKGLTVDAIDLGNNEINIL